MNLMSVLSEVLDIIPTSAESLVKCIRNLDHLNKPFLNKLQQCCDEFYSKEFSSAQKKTAPLLDYTWEKLNTGHWKDVNINWRYAYTVISIVKCTCQVSSLEQFDSVTSRKKLCKDILRDCDMGLLMGAPVLDNVLSRICTIIHKYHASMDNIHTDKILKRGYTDEQSNESDNVKQCRVEKASTIAIDSEREIQREVCPSLQQFKSEYMDCAEPVIITGLMDHWPAMSSQRWSVKHIKDIAGHRTVPIEIGSKYTEDTWTQTLMTVEDFINKYIISSIEIGYLAQHQLFDQVPELRNDIITPDYCYLGNQPDVDINAWFGPKGTVSPLHYDPKHNLLCQVMGEKYIRLYSSNVSDMVYPHPDMLLCNTSRVDVENPDFNQFPEFKNAPYTECILKEGEMVYMPPKYWHFVKSLSISFSVSFWFC